MYICSPFLTDVNIMGQGSISYYIKKVAKHAEIIIITSKEYEILNELEKNGVKVFINPRLHAKLILVRRGKAGLAIVGSANLTYGGIARNEEICILVDDDKVLNRLETEFNKIRVKSRTYRGY